MLSLALESLGRERRFPRKWLESANGIVKTVGFTMREPSSVCADMRPFFEPVGMSQPCQNRPCLRHRHAKMLYRSLKSREVYLASDNPTADD
jgi:hypothetical protein